MPRYFFNVHDSRSPLDLDGTDLPSLDAARVVGIKLAGEILRDEAERILLDPAWRLAVLDEAGEPVFEVDVHLSASGPDGLSCARPESINEAGR